MELEFAAPSAALAPYVSLFYRFRDDRAVIDGIERADVGQVRFMIGGRASMTFAHGATEPAPAITIIGPGTGAARFRVDGPCDSFGFSLRPIGWGAIIGLSAKERADHLTDGEMVFGPEGSDVLAVLGQCHTLDAMVDCATPFLIDRVASHPIPPDHSMLAEAVRQWLVRGDPIDVADLFAALPWSSRQVTRLVNHYFGGPPKFLERKFRALRAATAIMNGDDPADVAGAFYDQSYMINEIRHFTGQTPGELSIAIDPFLAMTLAEDAYNELSPVDDVVKAHARP